MAQHTQACNQWSLWVGARRRVIRAVLEAAALALVATTIWTPAIQAQSAPTITLSGSTTALPFREFATRELGDPWDMSQRTDLGWFTWGVDSPASNLSSMGLATDGFGNTYFTGQAIVIPATPTPYSDPSFFLLDTWAPGSAKLGKIGVNYPVDTTVYNTLYLKMKIANQILTTAPVAQVFWSTDTIYPPGAAGPGGGSMVARDALNRQVGVYLTPIASEPFGRVEGGNWVVYRIPLTIAEMKKINANIDHWENQFASPSSGATSASWGTAGVSADSLRVSPLNTLGTLAGEIRVDWARLVNETTSTPTTVSWSGGDAYDVVVSTQANCGDFAVVAYGANSPFQLTAQALPPGTYRVGLRKPFKWSGHTATLPGALDTCSSATFTVQDYPSLSLTSPNVEGSTDDFATTVLGNAWDFDALTDIDFSRNVNVPDASFGIVSRSATDAAGNDLGSVRVFRNRSTDAAGGVGDPHIYPLWPIPSPPAPPGTRARGLDHRIDTSRYRILTADLGVERARDTWRGSIARIVWHVDGERKLDGNLAEIESSDIYLRHLDPATQNGGKIVLDTVQVDMADRYSLAVETDYPQPGSGWKNTCTPTPGTSTCNTSSPTYKAGVDLFRLDFHEFSSATDSDVRRIKLSALERTGNSFQIQWTATNPSSLASTVTLKAVPVTNAAASNYRPLDRTCSTPSSIAITNVPVSLASGSFAWTPGTTPGITNGAEYFVCAQVFVSGVTGAVGEVLSRWPIVVDTSPTDPSPFTVSPTALRFGAMKAGAAGASIVATGAQAVTVTVAGASTTWTATSDRAWVQLTNATGAGAGQFMVSIINPGNVLGGATTALATISLTPGTVGVASHSIPVTLTIDQTGGAGSAPPFGLVDTPRQNTTGVVGTIGVTGWVLDDLGVTGVKIYRNCLAFEPQTNCVRVGGASVVFVGDATLVTGARPDVETLYPTYPQANRAAWGYLLLTNLLPHVPNGQMFGGQGALTLSVLATDVEGKQTWLGRTQADQTPTTITLANDTIGVPFGAIDTPAQGQTVSGIVPNFGWALTPDSNTTSGAGDIFVPTTGSTLRVYVDGVPIGAVVYNQCRGTVGSPVPAGVYCDDDVSSIFGNSVPLPTYTPRLSNPTTHRNLDAGQGAIGSYLLDTTTLTNGLHTIMWGVTDSAGRSEGVGSRYFTVLNTGADAGAARGFSPAEDQRAVGVVQDVSPAGAAGDTGAGGASGVVRGFSPAEDQRVVGVVQDVSPAITARTGFDLAAPWVDVTADDAGVRHVQLPELSRLELRLGTVDAGYLAVDGELRDLPPGSHLEVATGHFTWAPGVGYYGTYRLTFVRGGEPIAVDMTIRPVSAAAPSEAEIRMQVDLPREGETVAGVVRIAGWALDPQASIGSGIDAVHVWAQRRDVPTAEAQFLGATALGGTRPDVAQAFGPQFGTAAFDLTTATLASGQYDLTVYVWNRRTARWEDARTVTVTVR